MDHRFLFGGALLAVGVLWYSSRKKQEPVDIQPDPESKPLPVNPPLVENVPYPSIHAPPKDVIPDLGDFGSRAMRGAGTVKAGIDSLLGL